MKAWILNKVCDLRTETHPLELVEMPLPAPAGNEILIRISCCGVCHTELDEIEGRAAPSSFPMIPGHQVIGTVAGHGAGATRYKTGDRVGVAWIFSACGKCDFCRRGMENLCEHFQGTGRDENGGYAEYMTVDENFAYAIPDVFSDAQAAPLLCAGAIGYRSLNLSGLQSGQTLGLSGFGASGHLVLKMAQYQFPDSEIFVFARSKPEQEFARSLGAIWTGDISEPPPRKAHAIIDTTPVWKTIVGSLEHLRPGGRLIINAIRKESSDLVALLAIRYQEHLWMEKEIKSVANITRHDVQGFLQLAARIPLIPTIERYPFECANEALLDLKQKHVKGAKVLVMSA